MAGKRWIITLVVLAACGGGATLATGTGGDEPAPEGAKVEICHRTGGHEYVQIEISENALPAHLAHGDLYPVPPNGCPSGPPGHTTTTTEKPDHTTTTKPGHETTTTKPGGGGTTTTTTGGGRHDHLEFIHNFHSLVHNHDNWRRWDDDHRRAVHDHDAGWRWDHDDHDHGAAPWRPDHDDLHDGPGRHRAAAWRSHGVSRRSADDRHHASVMRSPSWPVAPAR